MAIDAQRTEAWLDTLPEHERDRAHYLTGLPPSMAAARIDRDLREEMKAGFAATEAAIAATEAAIAAAKNDLLRSLRADATTAPHPTKPSKGALIAASMLGGAFVQGIAAAFHNLK